MTSSINQLFVYALASICLGAAAQTPLPPTQAEVRKIDPDTKKITLKHEAIRNLEMPPMTMVFQVKDSALLNKAQVGDKVTVTIDKINGAFTVMTLEAAK